ncbi:hypothetical protein K438DRAFT_1993147 [Mycena galopus ATCC 62051]|nr:hypothetical protein K438DRAFT_1993147 [Mycena galopus ATCC 62051]
MAGLNALEAVSCTMVALPGLHLPALESHTFSNLYVSATALIPSRTNTLSIDLSALLGSIFSKTQLPDYLTGDIPPFFQNILTHCGSYPGMRVATTSVPIFDNRRQNPAYGYRNLGHFNHFFPHPTTTGHIHAVSIDCGTWDLPEIPVYKNVLETSHIRTDRHFILMIYNYGEPCSTTSIIPLATTTCDVPRTSSTTPPLFPCTNYFPSFDVNDPSLYLLQDLDPAQESSSFNCNPHSEDFGLGSSPSIPAEIGPVTAKEPLHALIVSPVFVQGLDPHFVLRHAGITSEEAMLGAYDKSTESLWAMVQNHHYMSNILQTFGLSVTQKDDRLHFCGGLTLTTEDLQRHLGWVPETFCKKSRIYDHARIRSRSAWKGNPPPDTDLSRHRLFLGW